jgi:ribose transport system ATP-binding protein
MENKQPTLSLKGIRKVFPGVVALNNVSIDFYPGEVHALIGENGAGKSTFIKTITGAHAPDGGTISIDGQTYNAMTPALARSHGIECIYQEFNLIDVLSAAENICYGEKISKFVNQKKMNEIAQKIFDDFGVDINPRTLVRDLTPGHMQIVEIAKSVSKKCEVLILDEPTAPLSIAEVDILFKIVNKLRNEGVAIIFISHRLDEVFELTSVMVNTLLLL